MEPQSVLYIDPVLKKYGDLIKQNCKAVKTVYYGDPVRVPSSNLPALVLAKLDTRVRKLTSAEDQHDIHISFTLITDIRDTISDEKTLAPGTNSLYNMMEGRNDDYTLKSESILNVLRHNIDVDPQVNLRTDLESVTSVDYGITVGKRGAESFATEAVVSIIANFNQIR